MVDPCDIAPPKALIGAWRVSGLIAETASWTRQTGGHSNPVWRVRDTQQDLICKLYHTDKASPLFGNHPEHEAIVLKSLSGNGLAPNLVASLDCADGPSLVYSYLAGPQWRGDIVSVAELLAKLHRQMIPDGLPLAPTLPQGVSKQIHLMQEMPSDLPEVLKRTELAELPAEERVLLHGDVVPGNLVETRDGLRLIDWQCPAIGDPCLDIAIFLSPAMQVIYGHRPLTRHEIEQFFEVYDRPDVTQRYRAYEPLFHLRMAAYCQWKGARGSAAHAAAVSLERAALSVG